MENKMFNDIIDSIINNARDDEIEIIREKLNNHLINHIYDSNIHEELSINMARIIKAIKDICVKNVQKHFLLLLVHCFHTLKSNLINGLNIFNLYLMVILLLVLLISLE